MIWTCPPKLSSGVTLIELLTVIVIVATLLAVGTSSFKSVTNSNRVTAEINGLLGDLQYARGEAIKEGQTVTLCVSTTGTSCTGGTSWNGGWLVFADANGNAVVNAGEAILRVQNPFTSTDTLTTNNNVTAFTFNREGYAVGVVAGTLVTLHDATVKSTWTRCLSVSMVGLMAVQLYGGACT